MKSILFDGAARRWSLTIGLLAGLAALLVTLAPSLDAQQQPEPPAWFFGQDAGSYVGAEVQAFNQNGVELPAQDNDLSVIDSGGGWSRTIFRSEASRVTFRIVHSSGTLETSPKHVVDGSLTEVSITEFSAVAEELGDSDSIISVRIIARRAEDGRIEFGMRDPDGEDIFPRARYFPVTGPDHNRFLRSSEIDFGDGFTGRIIARRAPDGRVEFGFRVEGYDDIFPRARYFPATGPDHNRFLRSSEIEIGQPR